MARFDDVVGYVYRADIYCPVHLLDTYRARRRAAGASIDSTRQRASGVEDVLDIYASDRGIDREDETTFDSDDFPKVILRIDAEPDDQCGACGDLIKNVEV